MAHPERLGKYRVTGVLGEGAMGIVYKGFDPDIRREVAIKTMRVAADADAGQGVSYADRFRNEAQAAGRLQHPGIVAVYDFGRDAGVDYIAMEYVRGNTLSRYITQAISEQLDINDDDVASIIGQLLEALDHAHAQGVWHRDIKPSNLIITPTGKVKVSDFGIARIENADLTQAASLIGTPAYMAPERFQGLPMDRRVDLYATGVVLYQMLTGRVPFSGPPEAIMYKAVHEPLVLPSRLPGLARLAPYDDLLTRALAKRAEDRFANAVQFMDALEAAMGRLHPDSISNATITALMPQALVAPGDLATNSSLPTGFSADDLAQAAARLSRHVGPMAQVMVKRVARGCSDLPTLYARLAEQVTDPNARLAFEQEAATLATGTGRPGATGTGSRAPSPTNTGLRGAPPTNTGTASARHPTQPAPTNTGGSAGLAPPSAAVVDAAQRLLARQIGPIATLVVKKALAAAPQRDAFIQRLALAVDDPAARARLVDELRRLPP
ncbi:MAG: serine/threonine protein kinase [Burkholderiaceae bacterium]|nr:serine/threonine protein kinase [Burkholderiaceae bacterium]